MRNINKYLMDQIKKAEENLRRSSPKKLNNQQVQLIEVIRLIDAYFSSIRFLGRKDNERITELLIYGYPTYMRLFYKNFDIAQNTPLYKSDENTQSIAYSILYNCGIISATMKVIDLTKYGIMQIESQTEKCISMRITKKYNGIEVIEQEEFRRYSSKKNKDNKQLYDDLNSKKPFIFSIMKNLVYVYNNDFLGYDTNQLIDDYYYSYALLKANEQDSYNCFDPGATFGGLPFKCYFESVVLLISYALKHIDFCLAFIEEHKNFNIINLLTIIYSKEVFLTIFMNYFNIKIDDAKKILNVVSLDENNISFHCLEPGQVPAPLIKISSTQIIRSIEGCINNPFKFMLEELRRQYPKEWDFNTGKREDIFREELYSFFPDEKYIKIRRNIYIKTNNEISTDIDACIINSDSGIIAFFQLKWMDPFGGSMRERESRRKNYENKTEKWINSIQTWINVSTEKTIADHLGIRPGMVEKKNFRLLIIGRNFSNFTSDRLPDDGVAWGLWYQTIRILKDCSSSIDMLEYLFWELIHDLAHNRLLQFEPYEFTINDLHIKIKPYDNTCCR